MTTQAALTKFTCSRCGGSGRYSFNLMHGTKCFGCNGAGYVMLDAKKEAARQARKAKAKEARKASDEKRQELVKYFQNKFSEEFGIPLLDGPEGPKSVYDLGCAVMKKYGKNIGKFVVEALNSK